MLLVINKTHLVQPKLTLKMTNTLQQMIIRWSCMLQMMKRLQKETCYNFITQTLQEHLCKNNNSQNNIKYADNPFDFLILHLHEIDIKIASKASFPSNLDQCLILSDIQLNPKLLMSFFPSELSICWKSKCWPVIYKLEWFITQTLVFLNHYK